MRALEAGGRRLASKAKEAAKDGRADAYHAAAVAFMTCASRSAPSREKCRVQAAQAWCSAGRAAAMQDPPSRQRSCHLYTQAGVALLDGLSSPRPLDAAACFLAAAEQCPRETSSWQEALRAVSAARVDSSPAHSSPARLADERERLHFLVQCAPTAELEVLFEKMAPLLDEYTVAGILWATAE